VVLLMDKVLPRSAEELAATLASAAAENRTIRIGGAFSKDRMAGPLAAADTVVSTAAMNRILQYEPRDLTISVEAGLRWADLTSALAANGQMIPLDPPFSDMATVGGVVAANTSGPRRRVYGSVRDVVIGMKYATLAGKLVQSGGMVVKNVAGLDTGKLMIGSFGTLSAIAVVNFKLAPLPPATRTFVLRFPAPEEAIAARDRILRGVLQPTAIDLVNPRAAVRTGAAGFCALVQASGNTAMLDRYTSELAGADVLDDANAEELWSRIREFTPAFLAEYPNGAVVRISTTLEGTMQVIRSLDGPVVARAGNGVIYGYFENAASVALDGRASVVEFAPEAQKRAMSLWAGGGTDFAIMEKIKHLFDPHRLLNPGRLYGRI
jgi:glycolate oxidase FAD binding subunit